LSYYEDIKSLTTIIDPFKG